MKKSRFKRGYPPTTNILVVGYTLVEILVVMTIIGVVFGVGFASFRGFARRQAVASSVRALKADLRLAQAQALAGKKPDHPNCNSPNLLDGYNFEIISNDEYRIDARCSGGNVEVKEVQLVSVSISAPTPNPILFKVLGQGTNIAAGTQAQIVLSEDQTGFSLAVAVSSSGEIIDAPVATPTPIPTPTPINTPTPTPGPSTIEVRVASSSDDAEERLSNGSVNLTSSDLELIRDGSNDQEVGMRFRNVTIPQGATITNVYIEFETDETRSEATSVTFYAQDIDDAPTFSSSTNNITSRTKTTASVAWNNIPAWNTVSEKHQTPNLSSIVQEVIDRPGWSSGNDLVVIVTGSGRRTAESYNGESANAPLLHVEFQ
ncbi:type II secretion system protein [Patescibacteria group bacterium]|nr:type II secretion system protein [Patescibacteria group bacterium]